MLNNNFMFCGDRHERVTHNLKMFRQTTEKGTHKQMNE